MDTDPRIDALIRTFELHAAEHAASEKRFAAEQAARGAEQAAWEKRFAAEQAARAAEQAERDRKLDNRVDALFHGLDFYTVEHAARQQKLDEKLAASAQQIADLGRTVSTLDRRVTRAIRAGVLEARRLRRLAAARDAEYRAQMEQLRAAHAATEATLRAFIDSLRRGGNGHHEFQP